MCAEEAYAGLVLGAPEVWGVEELGVDSVTIRLVLKTRPNEQFPVARELRARIKQAFDEEGIEIPFPQRSVWHRRSEGDVVDPVVVGVNSAGPGVDGL